MSQFTYLEGQKYCIENKVKDRDGYRALRRRDVKAYAKMPVEPDKEPTWAHLWTGWPDFLRDGSDVPKGAEHIENHYYRFEGSIYSHTVKGFKKLSKRKHPNGKFISDIRTTEGKVKSIYLDPDDTYVPPKANVSVIYQSAWIAFQDSSDYKRTIESLSNKGIVQPYADNILRSAFDSGFYSRP